MYNNAPNWINNERRTQSYNMWNISICRCIDRQQMTVLGPVGMTWQIAVLDAYGVFVLLSNGIPLEAQCALLLNAQLRKVKLLLKVK